MAIFKEIRYVLSVLKQREYISSCNFCYLFHLQHLPYGVGAVSGENLIEVDCHAVACQRAVTHDEVVGLLLGNGFDGFLGHVAVEAGDQIIVRHIEHFLAGDGGLLDFAGKQHAQIQHHLEQQILRRSVLFDVILKAGEQAGFIRSGIVVDLFHIGGVALEDAEAGVREVLSRGLLTTEITETAFGGH